MLRRIVCEEEPITKLESLELPAYKAAKRRAHIGFWKYFLNESGSEKINVTGRVIEGL